jgi:hypothetical protein
MNDIQYSAPSGTEWTARDHPWENSAMGRYRFTAYLNDGNPRYVVMWDLQWKALQSQRLEPNINLRVAMTAAIDAQVAQGWQAEGSAEYGFVFIRRDRERRLLMLTPRNPDDRTPQSFSPFRR